MTDHDIINLIRNNKYNPALKGLYTYLAPVKKFILNNNGTRQEAEDIFQEARSYSAKSSINLILYLAAALTLTCIVYVNCYGSMN